MSRYCKNLCNNRLLSVYLIPGKQILFMKRFFELNCIKGRGCFIVILMIPSVPWSEVMEADIVMKSLIAGKAFFI